MDDTLNHKTICHWYHFFRNVCGRITASEATEWMLNNEVDGSTVKIDESYFGKRESIKKEDSGRDIGYLVRLRKAPENAGCSWYPIGQEQHCCPS